MQEHAACREPSQVFLTPAVLTMTTAPLRETLQLQPQESCPCHSQDVAVVSVRFQTAPSAASLDTLSEGYPGQAVVNSSGIFLRSTRLMFIECAKLACMGSDLTFLLKTQAPPLGSGSLLVFSASTHTLPPCTCFQISHHPLFSRAFAPL